MVSIAKAGANVANNSRRLNLLLPIGHKFYCGSPLSGSSFAVAKGNTEDLLADDKCELNKPYRESPDLPLARQDYFVTDDGRNIFKQATKLAFKYSHPSNQFRRNTGGLIGFFGPSGSGKTLTGLRYALYLRDEREHKFSDTQYLYLSFRNGWSQETFTTYEKRGFTVQQYTLVLMDHVFRGRVLGKDAEIPHVSDPRAALLELGKQYAEEVDAITRHNCLASVVLHIDEHAAVHNDPQIRRSIFDCLTDLSLELRQNKFFMFLVATSISAPPPPDKRDDASSANVYYCFPIPIVNIVQAVPFLKELLPVEGKGADQHAHDFGHLCMQIAWSIPAVGEEVNKLLSKYFEKIAAARATEEQSETVKKTVRLCQSAVAIACSVMAKPVRGSSWSSYMSALALGVEAKLPNEFEPWLRQCAKDGHVIQQALSFNKNEVKHNRLTIPCSKVLVPDPRRAYIEFRCGYKNASDLSRAIHLARQGLQWGVTCLNSSFVSEAVGLLALLCMIHAHEHLHEHETAFRYADSIPNAKQFQGLQCSKGVFVAASEKSASEEPVRVVSSLGHELRANVVYVPMVEVVRETKTEFDDDDEIDEDLKLWLEFPGRLGLREYHPLIDIWYIHSGVFWLISITDRRASQDLAEKREKLQSAVSLMRARVQEGLQCVDGTTVNEVRGIFWDGLELHTLFRAFPIWSEKTHKFMVNKDLCGQTFF